GGSSADSANKGLFRSLRTIQLYVRWRKAGDCARMHHVRRGKDCYAGVAFKQTWIEDKQCAFALWFLQLL
ncbi:MAG: hypothetical protein QOE55_5738, partial [Acidobacteriaceae bacterium]|nr:hypothetical protein [Acidobacteriaceae bacterium]